MEIGATSFGVEASALGLTPKSDRINSGELKENGRAIWRCKNEGRLMSGSFQISALLYWCR